MEQEYGSNIISITDEDGVEYELEVLSTVTYRGAEYLALIPADTEEEAEDLEVSILKSVMEDGEPMLIAVEDDGELEAVYDLFMQTMYADDGEEDDEE